MAAAACANFSPTSAEAKQLGAREPALKDLKAAAEKLDGDVHAFTQLVEQTVEQNQSLANDRQRLESAAQLFVATASAYREEMYAKAAGEIATNAATQTEQNRLKKIIGINQVLQIGESGRLAAWQCQAQRNFDGIAAAQTALTGVKPILDGLRPLTTKPADLKQFDDLEQATAIYASSMESIVSHWRSRDQINKARMVLALDMANLAGASSGAGLTNVSDQVTRSTAILDQASLFVYLGLLATVVVGTLLAYLIIRRITGALSRVARTIGRGSLQVAGAAGQFLNSGQTLAAGASEQAASLEETSSSLEEMSSMTRRNSESARKANDLAKEARAAADKGAADMEVMSTAMQAIKVSSDDIAKIIKTIDEIAFQTNILALNAAVEAARAGDSGMGFAVVADEVRSLAQRSAQAARETTAKIEDAIVKTAQGVEISAKATRAFAEIVAKVRQVDDLVAEVAHASQEQTQGIAQINQAVGEMDKVTQGNAATAEEGAGAAQELNAQAESMKGSVQELLALVGHQESAHPSEDVSIAGPDNFPRRRASAPARTLASVH
ncbi:MAG TPA: methyl-accepting chemotaxis protein [Verrucomicrobiae bacterium]|jgi:methyl-accepting chemotaxis protein|nr:methyl-accepting chemotaxis protein [Verrucomicrobiae bacterium]